ncbi:ankyrin repeat-containing domain protein [Trichophaea hybrida]|nr:ankyrin repeat-containing domain protein [Trichophaea hybrida]
MSQSPFLSLPPELHNLIFSNLSQARTLYTLSRTCRHFSILAAPFLLKFAVQAKDSYVLRWAASVNNTELMKRLLHAGVDVSATESLDMFDDFLELEPGSLECTTTLKITLEAGHTDALKVLLDHGGGVIAQLLADSYRLLQTPAKRGDIPMLEILLEYIPSDQRSDNDYLIWSSSVSAAIEIGQAQTVEFFLDRGLEFVDPLHAAASNGQTEVAKIFLERGVIEDIEARSERWYDKTALDLAAEVGKVDLICLLLEKGADKNCTSEEGTTPVHHAAKYGRSDALRILVQKGADVNVESCEGLTPIHLATQNDQGSILEVLIQMGGDVNATDNEGQTALHHAANSWNNHGTYSPGCNEIARRQGVDLAWLLLRNGAALDQKDDAGWTAMDAAVMKGRIGMARALLMARTSGGIENFASSLPELYENLERIDSGYDEYYFN